MHAKNIGLYIHIPFCKKKCEYCDFKSYAGQEALIDEYIKWLNYEIELVGKSNKADYENGLDKLAVVNTIYIGGGTPSFIEEKYIQEILETIKNNYAFPGESEEKVNTLDVELKQNDKKIPNYIMSNDKTIKLEKDLRNVEVTIEVNPGTVNEDKLKTYKASGINRLSIGLQETHNEILKDIGRIHTYQDFLDTYQIARKVGFRNINIDLMLALPGQSIENLSESVDKIIQLNPEHISVYSLIIEEGTQFYKKYINNELQLPEDEVERKMYWLVKHKLEEVGYKHYEISNFAKPGYESKHNLACWNQEEYIGLGVSAHSYTNNIRYSNIDNIPTYMQNLKSGKDYLNLVVHEKQNKESKMKEYIMLGLRKIDGVYIQNFKQKFGENPIYLYREKFEKLVHEDLLEMDGDIIRLTNKGLDLANLVWEEFV